MTDSQQGLRSGSGEPHPDFNVDQPVEGSATPANGTTSHQEDHEEGCDDCPSMSGRTLGYWLTLVFFVGPFYVIPPLSWAYTVYATIRLGEAWVNKAPLLRALPTWEWAVLPYTVFECGFSVYYYFLCRRVSRRGSQVPKRDPAELRLAIRRLLEDELDYRPTPAPSSPPAPPKPSTTNESERRLFTPSSPPPRLASDDPRAVDFRNHFGLWFHGKPWREISRQSMREWFAWSLFDLRHDELDEAQKTMVEDAVVLVECRAGCLLSDEEDDGGGVVRLTSDPIVTWSRPGLLYVIGGVMNLASEWWLKWRYGMVKQEFAGIE
ncbi:hypothetical protein FRC01_000863 [Tulasnella sp. 417]|nr:hypothetical protein FRC01_000863 [Tulasnella sp. 417]